MILYSLILSNPLLAGEEVVFDFVPAPEAVRYESPSSTTLQRLPHGASFREGYGMGIEIVTLQGTFGFRRRQVRGVEKTGDEIFSDLRRLYEFYQSRMQSRSKQDKQARLEFHDWKKDKHWFCEWMNFSEPAGKENRTFRRYEISLHLYTPIVRTFESVRPDAKGVMKQTHQEIILLSTKIQGYLESLSKVKERTANAIRTSILKPLQETTQTMERLVTSTLDTLALPARMFSQIANAVATACEDLGELSQLPLVELSNTLRQVRRALFRLLSYPDLFFDGLESVTRSLAGQFANPIDPTAPVVVQNDQRQGRQQALRAEAAGLQRGATKGVRRVRVLQGDSLQRLALRELGDQGRWKEIALLNGLERSPFLTPDGLAGTAQEGSEIFIPEADPQGRNDSLQGALGSPSLVQRGATSTRLYGRDLRLIDARQGRLDLSLAVDGTPAVVEGEENLLQAARLKTRVFQGELLEERRWGMRRVFGKKATSKENEELRWSLKETILSDPRISRVELDLVSEGNVNRVEVMITPNGRSGAVQGITGRVG